RARGAERTSAIRHAVRRACPLPADVTRVRDRRADESLRESFGGSGQTSHIAPLRSEAATRPDTCPPELRATTRRRRRDTAGALPRTGSRGPLTRAVDDSSDSTAAQAPNVFDRCACLRVARRAAIARQANRLVGNLVASQAVARVAFRS